MKEKWISLCSRFTDDMKTIEKTFIYLEKHYQSVFRHYHNFSHINSMLDTADKYSSGITSYHSLQFAVWFHDVIYKTYRNDNEEKSAEISRKMLTKLNIPEEMINRTSGMILKTKHIKTIPSALSEDEKFLVDIDLLILGSDRPSYLDYMKRIRKEYFYIPDIIYNKNRNNLLYELLNSESIYFSDIFKSGYEQQARDNIYFEIRLLI